MVSRRKPLEPKSKRPEKVAPSKRTLGSHPAKGASRRAIEKRPPSSAIQQAARNLAHRTVLLDACNISHYNQRMPRFSVARLSKAITHFVEAGHAVHAVMPRFHLYTRQWNDPDRLNGLYRKNYIITTPCKEFPNPKSQVYDDRILMAIASKYNCAVVSNDMFRDMAHEHPQWSYVVHNLCLPFWWDSAENFHIPSNEILRH
uniref:RNase_Zc3h12a domain-containing protein n=1 Tax=Anopheles dirus TaxID=7168 RepID=A0A182NRX9_9DIPT